MRYPWITETIEEANQDYRIIAKVYDEPSGYGIDGGRISKMQITNLETNQIVYNYDRGLDFDIAPPGMVDWAILFITYRATIRHIGRFQYVLTMAGIANALGMALLLSNINTSLPVVLFLCGLIFANVATCAFLSNVFSGWEND